MGVDLFVLLSCFLIRFALRHMYLAVTSGALTPLCGQPSAKCWVTWLYSYDKSKRTWWAFWHQRMVPCPWLHTVLFLWMPYGFYLTLPQLILFKSFFGLWLCLPQNSHIINSSWLVWLFFSLPLNKRDFVLISGCPSLFHSFIVFACFSKVYWNPPAKTFCMTNICVMKTDSQLRNV